MLAKGRTVQYLRTPGEAIMDLKDVLRHRGFWELYVGVEQPKERDELDKLFRLQLPATVQEYEDGVMGDPDMEDHWKDPGHRRNSLVFIPRKGKDNEEEAGKKMRAWVRRKRRYEDYDNYLHYVHFTLIMDLIRLYGIRILLIKSLWYPNNV
jgi:hypothetical protein